MAEWELKPLGSVTPLTLDKVVTLKDVGTVGAGANRVGVRPRHGGARAGLAVGQKPGGAWQIMCFGDRRAVGGRPVDEGRSSATCAT